MIKIIKPGKTDFRLTCDKCGCIFEYNVEDIDDSYIKCPTCGKMHYGFQDDQLTYTISGTKPTGTFRLSTDPCEDCDFTKTLRTTGYYIGDTPCQWCNKNPYRLTCATATYTTSADNETGGVRSWTTTSDTTFSETAEDAKITSKESLETIQETYTCTAEGVSYNTTIDTYQGASFDLDNFTNTLSEVEKI